MWLKRPSRALSDFGYVNMSGYADDPAVQAQAAKNANAFTAYNAAKAADARKQFTQAGITALSAVAAPALLGSGSLSGLFSGAGGGGATLPSAATAGVGFDAAGPATSAGTAATLGKVFNSRGMDLGVKSALSLFGQHAQTKAADQARADALKANTAALALEREKLEAEARDRTLDRADAKALNDAINELKKRELDAAEEERTYQRTRTDQADARLQPYRQISEQALARLSSMWGL